MQRPHAAPIARSASGKRAAVRRGRACSTDATSANVTALSPKSETKLPKKHAPSGGSPSALPSAVVSAIPPVVVQPKTKYEIGVEVSDAITPRPSPAGTAVLRLRNSAARAANPAYSATMTCTTTKGQKVGLRSVLTADVSAPTAMPTTGAAGPATDGLRPDPSRGRALHLCLRLHAARHGARARGVRGARDAARSHCGGHGRVWNRSRDGRGPERSRCRRRRELSRVQPRHEIGSRGADSP